MESVLRGYEAFNRGDLEAAAQGFSPDFELRVPPIVPDTGPYRGRDGLRRLRETWETGFEDLRFEIEEVIDAGDRVVVMASVCGRGRDSGADVRTPSFPYIWTFRDGQVVSMEPRPNRAAALEAVGLEGRSG